MYSNIMSTYTPEAKSEFFARRKTRLFCTKYKVGTLNGSHDVHFTSYFAAYATHAYVQILWRCTLNVKQIKEIAAPALVPVVGNIEDLRDNAHGWYSVICYME